MQILADISEDEMIAAFLRAEWASERFGADLQALVLRDGINSRIVTTPDLTSAAENAYRRALLGEFRGYGRNSGLFEDFPSHLAWQRVALTSDELLAIKYIDWDYWVALSRGTRLPRDAAQAIRQGRRVYDVPPDGFLRIAEALRQGALFPELICVRQGAGAPLVVVEGHVRLTAYALAPQMIPTPITIILATGPGIAGWGSY